MRYIFTIKILFSLLVGFLLIGCSVDPLKVKTAIYDLKNHSNGKIAVVGSIYDGTTRAVFAVGQYNSDGSIDTSYGTNGITQLTGLDATHDSGALALTIDSSDRVIAVGFKETGTDKHLVIARFTTTGSLDTTFDTDGIQTLTTTTDDEIGASVRLQSDGKIVVYAQEDSTDSVLVARYTSAGALDATFGTAGKTSLTFNGNTYNIARGMQIQSDDKIIITGQTGDSNAQSLFIARLSANGALDNTFGTAGIKVQSLSGTFDTFFRPRILSDGSILVAGTGNYNPGNINAHNSYFMVAKYSSSGSLDTSFGSSSGYTEINFTALADTANAFKVLSDGKIVVIGTAAETTTGKFAAARLNSDGTLDTTFGGGDGKKMHRFGRGTELYAFAMDTDANDKIVVGGATVDSGGTASWSLTRLLYYRQ